VSTDFVAFTEVAGDEVSAEQVERIARRYYWAAGYCRGKDVLEAACGTGQGLGLLSRSARSLTAGDYSPAVLDIARRHYGSRFDLKQFDAQHMPFADASFDVVILFEALYYVPDVERFFRECKRVLRPGGTLLIATANKDLFDFTPGAHTHRYLGVQELHHELGSVGFEVHCYGDAVAGRSPQSGAQGHPLRGAEVLRRSRFIIGSWRRAGRGARDQGSNGDVFEVQAHHGLHARRDRRSTAFACAARRGGLDQAC
jgi:SAM-dependent methyltransferase